MNQKAILTLALVHGGKLSASRKGMLLFVFADGEKGLTFADSTGGMLIKGMERGSVFCAVRLSDEYAAGHQCNRCQAPITDMEYVASGLLCGVCPECMDLMLPPISRFREEGEIAVETVTQFNQRRS